MLTRLPRLSCIACGSAPVVAGRQAQALLQRYPQPKWVEQSTRRLFSSSPRRHEKQEAVHVVPHNEDRFSAGPVVAGASGQERLERIKRLPVVCPGCGAHSQTVAPHSAGYYHVDRGDGGWEKGQQQRDEDDVFRQAMHAGALGDETRHAGALGDETRGGGGGGGGAVASPPPICGRCHELLYQSRGQSIVHPSMESLQAMIEESPHRHNHIYHVLDAADFPLSLIPHLPHALDLPRLRTRNRRSKTVKYVHDRVADVTFVIARSDLLAPHKEQVDALLPYLQDVLRDALGRDGRKLRLGNVRCVSAKRGWWTRTLKDDIWRRGAAGWMVGKVNVGKSALFEVVFPKGRSHGHTSPPPPHPVPDPIPPSTPPAFTADSPGDLSEGVVPTQGTEDHGEIQVRSDHELDHDDDDDEPSDIGPLLPPAQPETPYPPMPLVSSLPGTTASPIRIPFGNKRGELIDLPGIQRTTIERHIRPEHHKRSVMTSRVAPEQITIKPGQSILLGGLIRITPDLPADSHRVMLAYAFMPPAFHPHLTSTAKAVAIQTGIHSDLSGADLAGQPYTGTVPTIATDLAKSHISSAGTFKLEWNVTKRRAGPLTDKAAGKQKADHLPFIIYSADLLVESVGWVELVCQTRRRSDSFLRPDALSELGMDGEDVPAVEVFSPEGKHVGVRRPMNGWLLGGPKKSVVGREQRRRVKR
ncbi:Genetic interactor of prohibitins 3 [Teratosphaeria destructans]|uniref:Genetic interactor of prohibitins 3 n=1 Tax=Teratosphaeria destructans TaxID=418781 RepID=A0A9W7SJA0_9PEZI|nr:Genetic interactor of prohibitins 3 [Teratosphaeria destructans]